MRAREMKSSKCRKEARKKFFWGIHASSPAHLHTACLLFRSGKRDAELKRIFFPLCFFLCVLEEQVFEGESCFITLCYLFSRHARHAAQLECFHSCLCNVDVSADQPWAGKSQFPESKQCTHSRVMQKPGWSLFKPTVPRRAAKHSPLQHRQAFVGR